MRSDDVQAFLDMTRRILVSNVAHYVDPTHLTGLSLTGLSWTEEVLAGVAKTMPYNAEAEMKRRCARSEKALVPFASNVVVDGRLITGQNPFSAKATVTRIAGFLR